MRREQHFECRSDFEEKGREAASRLCKIFLSDGKSGELARASLCRRKGGV